MNNIKEEGKQIKFYEGQKIYHKGHVVNVISQGNALGINYISNDPNFNMDEFMEAVEHYTAPIALTKQVIHIRNGRIKAATDFTLSKENMEYLSAELMPQAIYKLTVQKMKINHWTLEELVKESLRTGFNMFMLSGTLNKAKEVMA